MTTDFDGLTAALSDRYTIQRELGRGGMARVYLAEDRKHHRPVALKVLRPDLAHLLGPERFLREIELAAQLAHPHILPLYDSGNLPDVPPRHVVERGTGGEAPRGAGIRYYVMPYVEGESLRNRLTRKKQLPVDDALPVRGQRVMLDADLAALYGVSTKRLNEQVRRNQSRFPEDFAFRLTDDEARALRSQIATSNTGRGGRRYAPDLRRETASCLVFACSSNEQDTGR